MTKNRTKSLIYNWPFCDDYKERIKGKNLTNYNTIFAKLNNGENRTYLLISNSYLLAPAEIYFSGDFTVSAWVYINSIRFYGKIFDFGNGPSSDNVDIGLSSTSRGKPYFEICRGSTQNLLYSNRVLPLKQWVHISVTLQNGFG